MKIFWICAPKHTSLQGIFHVQYRHVFPVLVRLAVDPEEVTSQLFRPLVMQLIHWLTKSLLYEYEVCCFFLLHVFSFSLCAGCNGIVQ